MDLGLQKRLAARILKTSVSKIVFDVNSLSQIKDAITSSDVKALIRKSIIAKKSINLQSRVRARKNLVQKKKGRRKGMGSRKGSKNSRTPGKTQWIRRVRIQRAFLKLLHDKGLIDSKTYKGIYLKSKGGFFRSRRHIKMYMEEHELIKHGTQ
ncbi:50S ribosomal protein L19e [Candidatus Woesearchaeota archaeon]|nr:50S ribosomal protein L19e [Candidatus Woesearchaeota archaeon]